MLAARVMSSALFLGALACSPLRPVETAPRTPYGNPEAMDEPALARVAEPEFEPPMGWATVTAEECGLSFAMPGQPTRSERASADGVHAVYTFEVDADTRMAVDCAETQNAKAETAASLRDGFAKLADDGEVHDLGPFDVAGNPGHGFQLLVRGAVHRYRVVVIGGRRVQVSVIGAHEYPGLYQSLRPLEQP